MPKADSATTRTDLADRNLNPSNLVAGTGQVVTVVLTYERAFVAEDLHDALITKYGAGKVISDTDTVARNNLRLRIKA